MNAVTSTVPPTRVVAEDVAAAGAVHALLVNQLIVTVPVGVAPLPVTVALSCTKVPATTLVTVPWVALWMVVVTVGVSFAALVTVSDSQGPVAVS